MQLFSIIQVLSTAVLVTSVAITSASTVDLSQHYAPTRGDCPSDIQWIRSANDGLNPLEAEWIKSRKLVVIENYGRYLKRLGLEGFNVSAYLERIKANTSGHTDVPALGLAISGGGYGSAYTGSGAMRALDDRLPAALEQRTGGLLQSLLYQSGLSGGSWPTISFLANGFPTADEIVQIWRPEIIRPASGISTQFAANVTSIFTDLTAKFKAGFPVTIGDWFGRAWGYEFVPGAYGGVDTTFSSYVDIPEFKTHQAPLPILHMTSIKPDDPYFDGFQMPTENASTYEVTPYEFGTWKGDSSSFTPTAWLGTGLYNGSVSNTSNCVKGFDKASFMMGSSASAVNAWYIEDISNGTLGTFAKRQITKRQDNIVPLSEIDPILDVLNSLYGEPSSLSAYASWPNPFAGLDTTTPSLRNASYLKLIDGSLNGQTIPMWSLIQPARALDFIFAWDDSQNARPQSWSNGSNLHNTYLAAKRDGIPFPIVPPASTFIAYNYTTRPVFFGCNTTLTTAQSPQTPIVLYLASAPYSSYTNASFAIPSTSTRRMHDIFVNSFDQLTQGNGTLDAEWAQCLGCATIDRSLERIGMQRTEQCERCLERYCWDGKMVEDGIVGPPGGTYEATEDAWANDLEMVLEPGISWAEWNVTHQY